MHTDKRQLLRLTELDALRGLAALSVLVYHFTGQFDRMYGHHSAVPLAFEIGKYGVQLFFMISGFVIFMSLEHTKHALDFVVSRFSRLVPAYWAALAVTLLAVGTAGLPGQQVSTHDALINITMLSDFFNAREADGSYWTLQIELFFYAQMLFWYVTGGIKKVHAIVIGWLLLVFAYGIAARLDVALSYTLREVLIVRYIAFFAAGVALYRAYHRRDSLWQSALLLGGCVLSVWTIWSWWEALVLVLCTSVFALVIVGKLKFLARQPFMFFGTVSYSLYLLHQEFGFIVIAHFERTGVAPWASILLAATAALVLATALTFVVERPIMRVMRAAYRRWRERSSPVAVRGPT